MKRGNAAWKWLLFGLMMATGEAQPVQDYVDPKFGFRLTLPADWKQTTVDEEDSNVVIARFENADGTMFLLVMREEARLVFPSENAYNRRMTEFITGVSEPDPGDEPHTVKEIGRRYHEINQQKVATMDFEFVYMNVSSYMRTRFVFADNQLYILYVRTLTEDFAGNEAVIDQILDSFTPKNPAIQEVPWVRILGVLGGICLVGVVGVTGTVLFILRAVRRRKV